jgi:hypothetical protein
METVSENQKQLRKRGRPTVFDDADRAAIPAIGQDVGPRQLANRLYCVRAIDVLAKAKQPERFKWLCPPLDNDYQPTGIERDGFKPTILSELGRLSDDPMLVEELALQLCEVKPKTTEAVATLRNYRLSVTGADRRPALPFAHFILNAADDYQRRHPGTTNEDALAALEEAVVLVRRFHRTREKVGLRSPRAASERV